MAYDAEQALALIQERIREHERENPDLTYNQTRTYLQNCVQETAAAIEDLESSREPPYMIHDAKESLLMYQDELSAMEKPTPEEIAAWEAELARLRDEERRHRLYLASLKPA